VGEINWFGPKARNSLELWLPHTKFTGKFSSKPSQNVMGGGFWSHEESWTYSGDSKVTCGSRKINWETFGPTWSSYHSFQKERLKRPRKRSATLSAERKEGNVNDHGFSEINATTTVIWFSTAIIANFSHVYKLLSMAKKPVSCRKPFLVLIQIFLISSAIVQYRKTSS
jgi:hypothetical protein